MAQKIRSGNTLTSTATNVSYQWIDCTTLSPVPGATSSSFAPQNEGSYALVISRNLCTDTTDCYNFTFISNSPPELAGTLTLFPNPNQGRFSLDLGRRYEEVFLSIYDMWGKRVNQTRYRGVRKIQESHDLPTGTYLLQVRSGQQQITKRMIVE